MESHQLEGGGKRIRRAQDNPCLDNVFDASQSYMRLGLKKCLYQVTKYMGFIYYNSSNCLAQRSAYPTQ